MLDFPQGVSGFGGIMETSLFQQLKKVGIDEEIAYQVSASLDPDYNASKKDVLVMQETILQMQMKSDQNYHELRREMTGVRSEIAEVRSDLHHDIAGVRSDLHHEITKVRSDLHHEISGVRSDLRQEIAGVHSDLRHDIHTTINRQYILTFGGILMTIATVVAVNWYFH